MVPYGINPVPLAEELRDADPNLLSPFYADDASFDGSARRSLAQLHLLMDPGLDRGYFPEPAKLLFIENNPEKKEAARRDFKRAGLHLNYVDGSIYLGDYLGPREELEEWVRPEVEAWAHGVRTLAKIAKRYPEPAYAGLGMSLQIEWQYLQITVPGVVTLMGPIEDALRKAFFPTIFVREEVSSNLR